MIKAFIAGFERLAPWADLLDDINVFPIADGDTGRNLIITLSPIRDLKPDPQPVINALLFAARGNSGNIAARFFSGLLTAQSPEELRLAVEAGRQSAWKSVADPKPGTMLTVFDELAAILEKFPVNIDHTPMIIDCLEAAVQCTRDQIPRLKSAGVIDAGALGMFIYLEGFFRFLFEQKPVFRSIPDRFNGMLHVSKTFEENSTSGYCVDFAVHLNSSVESFLQNISKSGTDIVMSSEKNIVKIHLHTDDRDAIQKKVSGFSGKILHWSADDLADQVKNFKKRSNYNGIHIMTDAAGSVTREDARRLGITLLDSYIITSEISIPETRVDSSALYSAMRSGAKVTTSQASIFERHQHFRRILDQYQNVLYLCVGSAYTGIYDVVMKWKTENDTENRLRVIDTGAASGRLGLIAMAAAKISKTANTPDAAESYVRNTLNKCVEYIFLDRLSYLAAGGRISKTSAFFGDLLHMKPIISPCCGGVKKVGVVRDKEAQLSFAIENLEKTIPKNSKAFIMLEYSDNFLWVRNTVKREIAALYPYAEIFLQPLSLTTGVHTGPGTWAVAFLNSYLIDRI